MAIDKDEIEKYIFDPENPKGCKSYSALLSVAKKDTFTYISKDFFYQFFTSDEILNQIEKELWDIPSNYTELTRNEKIELYIKQFSSNDFLDLLDNIALADSIFDNLYFYIFSEYRNSKYYNDDEYYYDFAMADANGMEAPNLYFSSVETKTINLEKNFRKLFLSYKDNKYPIEDKKNKWNGIDEKSKILLYNFDNTNILDIKTFFKRSTILITTLEYKNKFLENNISENIKPIFLKKIEDVDLLLNVLEQDLKQTPNQNNSIEEIKTLNYIKIKDVFSIKQEIEVRDLRDKKEIYIVGENGDGKTLLLQAIAVGLKGTAEDGLKAFRDIENNYTIEIEEKELCQNNFLAYGAMRNSVCQMKEDKTGFLTLFSGEYDLKSPIDWLLALDYSEKSEKKNIISVKEAKKLLQTLLNSDIEIDIVPPNQVTFREKGSIVDFNQLSAGYKGVITIVCDLIVRLSQTQEVEAINEFQGIVLIDEVELHLHPKWSYGFMKKLRDTFPLIQFIVTTHSPTVILGASKEAVFYKIYKDEGEVRISNQIINEGYTQNSLVSSPLFDLENITSRFFEKSVSSSDYVYSKIHKVISKRLKEDIDIDEDELMRLIDDELDKL